MAIRKRNYACEIVAKEDCIVVLNGYKTVEILKLLERRNLYFMREL